MKSSDYYNRRYIDTLAKSFDICFSCLYALYVSKRCINLLNVCFI